MAFLVLLALQVILSEERKESQELAPLHAQDLELKGRRERRESEVNFTLYLLQV